MIKYLSKDIDAIQSFMNSNIGNGKTMTGADIYKGAKGFLKSEMNENTFKTSLSANVKAGNIKGFYGRKRVGYVKDGDELVGFKQAPSESEDAVVDEQEPTEQEPEDRFVIQLTKTVRVAQFDRLNFGVQRYKNNTWTNQGYNSSLGDALKSGVKFLIKNKLKDYSGVHDIKEAINVFTKIEAAILGELISMAGTMPLDRKDMLDHETETETETETTNIDDKVA